MKPLIKPDLHISTAGHAKGIIKWNHFLHLKINQQILDEKDAFPVKFVSNIFFYKNVTTKELKTSREGIKKLLFADISAWGDCHYIGLSKCSVYGGQHSATFLQISSLSIPLSWEPTAAFRLPL